MEAARPQRRKRIVEAVVVCLLLGLGLGLRVRIHKDWEFVGQDSFDYLLLATEMTRHHRYATGPDRDLHYSRPPGYALLLALVEGPVGHRTEVLQIGVDVAITGLLAWLLARRLGGPVAGAIALAATLLCPWTAFYASTILTESVATAITMGVVTLLLLDEGRAGRLRWWGAGALFGLGMLFRPDTVLLAPAFLPSLLAIPTWRARARVGALALLGFVLIYGAWPVRNLIHFGKPYWFGGYLTVDRRPIEAPEGYRNWVGTWAWDHGPVPVGWCFYNPTCPLTTNRYPAVAFDTPAERSTVERLFVERSTRGFDRRLSAEFDVITAAHRSRRPLQTGLVLPLRRAVNLWINRHDELIGDARFRPWRAFYDRTLPWHDTASGVLFYSFLVAGGLLYARRRSRDVAATLLLAITARTVVLAVTNAVEPRYLTEVMPLAFILVAGGAVDLARRLASLVNRVKEGSAAAEAAQDPV